MPYNYGCCRAQQHGSTASCRRGHNETQQEPGALGLSGGCPAAWCCADGSRCASVLSSDAFEFGGHFIPFIIKHEVMNSVVKNPVKNPVMSGFGHLERQNEFLFLFFWRHVK